MKKTLLAAVAALTIVLGAAPTYAQVNGGIGTVAAPTTWPAAMPPVQPPPTWRNGPLDFPAPPLGPPPAPLSDPSLHLH